MHGSGTIPHSLLLGVFRRRVFQRRRFPRWRPLLIVIILPMVVFAVVAIPLPGSESAGGIATAWGFGMEGIRRDSFPVFNNPAMISAREAEAKGMVFPRDAVIGVALNGEAKAYPISIMGYHELGNDTLGGVPIAVSW
jgi:hypothetical protein